MKHFSLPAWKLASCNNTVVLRAHTTDGPGFGRGGNDPTIGQLQLQTLCLCFSFTHSHTHTPLLFEYTHVCLSFCVLWWGDNSIASRIISHSTRNQEDMETVCLVIRNYKKQLDFEKLNNNKKTQLRSYDCLPSILLICTLFLSDGLLSIYLSKAKIYTKYFLF